MITAGYLAGLWFLLEPKVGDWEGLKLNEVGDFLAGAFGPLAIFWLVLGYFQQGSELRQNNEALKLQAEELRNSVAQQRELVAVTTKQVEHALEHAKFERLNAEALAMPKFDITHVDSQECDGVVELYFEIVNVGETARAVDIFLMEGDGSLNEVTTNEVFSKGIKFIMSIKMPAINVFDMSKSIRIVCRNLFESEIISEYQLSIQLSEITEPYVTIRREC